MWCSGGRVTSTAANTPPQPVASGPCRTYDSLVEPTDNPAAPAPERYELPITVLPDDIDDLGHVNNVVYLRWIQDVAIAHWGAAATPEQQAEVAWVALRHEIDYKLPTLLGDEVVARTWVGTAESHRFERNTEIVRVRDQKVLARGRTVWCPINRATGRRTRVSEAVRQRFSVPAAPDATAG